MAKCRHVVEGPRPGNSAPVEGEVSKVEAAMVAAEAWNGGVPGTRVWCGTCVWHVRLHGENCGLGKCSGCGSIPERQSTTAGIEVRGAWHGSGPRGGAMWRAGVSAA